MQGCTPLYLAAQGGHIDVLKLLLASGANAVGKSVGGRTPLAAAATAETVHELLSSGADIADKDQDGSTPLHAAAAWGHLDVLKALIEHGARVHTINLKGYTPLHMAALLGHLDAVKALLKSTPDGAFVDAKDSEDRLLQSSIRKGSVALVQLFLLHGADVQASDCGGRSVIHLACLCEDADDNMRCQIVTMLIAHGASINAKDGQGFTPLANALVGDHPDLVSLLLSCGADTAARSSEGITALFLAVGNIGNMLQRFGTSFAWDKALQEASLETVAKLIKHGADVHAASDEGQTPLHVVAFGQRTDKAELLLANGADVNARDVDGQTALHTAAGWGCPGSIRLLLQHGADAQALFKGENCLQYAARGLLLEVVKSSFPAAQSPSEGVGLISVSFLWLGATDSMCLQGCNAAQFDAELARFAAVVSELLMFGFDLEAPSAQGMTALHIAAENGHPELVEILLSHGTRVDSINLQGCTPLHTAAAQDQPESLRLLLTHGADTAAVDSLGRTALHHAAAAGSTAKVHFKHNEDVRAFHLEPQVSHGSPVGTAANERH
ncbi:hypothetical protein ABBQ32_013515 [Trebouxia sp. C0010 RCD-2024]